MWVSAHVHRRPSRSEDQGPVAAPRADGASKALCARLQLPSGPAAALRQAAHPLLPPPQVDEIPLSRPKRSIARDFSDGGAAPTASCLPHALAWCSNATDACPSQRQQGARPCHLRSCTSHRDRSDSHCCEQLMQCAFGLSCAVLVAEIVKNFHSRLVDLHNYRWDARGRFHLTGMDHTDLSWALSMSPEPHLASSVLGFKT